MKLLAAFASSVLVAGALASAPAIRNGIKPKNKVRSAPSRRYALQSRQESGSCSVVTPKLFIISMFDSEANVWYEDTELNLYANNITIPGFSPLFPQAHCTESGEICQLTTGEGGGYLDCGLHSIRADTI